MKQQEVTLEMKIVFAIIFMGLLSSMFGCTKSCYPSKRKINRAMKYSSWEYEMPKVKNSVSVYYNK